MGCRLRLAHPLPIGFLMNIEDLLSSPFSFRQRKIYTPCDTRPIWKCTLVILIIGVTGRERKCSLKKIHTAGWITKSPEHLQELIDWSKSESLFPPNIRLDPSIDRAIELVAASGYAYKTDGKIALTDSGENLLTELENLGVMEHEKNALKASKKYLSEAAVERIFKAN